MARVDPNEIVADLLGSRPQAVRVFLRHRMACPGCGMAPFETLEEVARVYGVPLQPFLHELEEAEDVHRDLPPG